MTSLITSLMTALIRYHKMCLWLASMEAQGMYVDALIGARVRGLMTTDDH